MGSKKGSQLCTGPWKEMNIMDGQGTRQRGKPLATAPNYAAYVPADNHAHLHTQYMPPAYMTDPNVTYAGTKREEIPSKSASNLKHHQGFTAR
jgi:hypothetical protein